MTWPGQEDASSPGIHRPRALLLPYQDTCASTHSSPSKERTKTKTSIIKMGRPLTHFSVLKTKAAWSKILPRMQSWAPSAPSCSISVSKVCLCRPKTCSGLAKGSAARIAWQHPHLTHMARLLCPWLAQVPHVLASHLG